MSLGIFRDAFSNACHGYRHLLRHPRAFFKVWAFFALTLLAVLCAIAGKIHFGYPGPDLPYVLGTYIVPSGAAGVILIKWIRVVTENDSRFARMLSWDAACLFAAWLAALLIVSIVITGFLLETFLPGLLVYFLVFSVLAPALPAAALGQYSGLAAVIPAVAPVIAARFFCLALSMVPPMILAFVLVAFSLSQGYVVFFLCLAVASVIAVAGLCAGGYCLSQYDLRAGSKGATPCSCRLPFLALWLWTALAATGAAPVMDRQVIPAEELPGMHEFHWNPQEQP